jgi:hypothetical protein
MSLGAVTVVILMVSVKKDFVPTIKALTLKK